MCGTGGGWRLGVLWLFLVCSYLARAGPRQRIWAAWGGWQVSLVAAELSPGALRGVAPEDRTVDTSTSFLPSGVSSPPGPANASF